MTQLLAFYCYFLILSPSPTTCWLMMYWIIKRTGLIKVSQLWRWQNIHFVSSTSCKILLIYHHHSISDITQPMFPVNTSFEGIIGTKLGLVHGIFSPALRHSRRGEQLTFASLLSLLSENQIILSTQKTWHRK